MTQQDGVARDGGGSPSPARRAYATTVIATLGVAAAGAAAALALGRLARFSFLLAALAVAVVVLVVISLLAIVRFEWFVIALLVARASLDALQLGRAAGVGTSVDPAAALGMVFIAAAALWLYVQWASGHWVRPSAATWSLFAFVGACILSVPLSGHKIDSVLAAAKLLAGVLMFAVIEQLIGRDPRRSRVIVAAALWSFLVPALAGMRQILSGEAATRIKPNYYGSNVLEGGSRVKGTFVHPNPFATYLVMILLFALAMLVAAPKRQRLRWAVLSAASAGLLLATYTRVGWFAALIGVGYLGLRHSRALLVGLGIVVVVVVAAVPSIWNRFADLGGSSEKEIPGVPSNSLSWRLGYWGDLLPLTATNPLTGVGIGTSQNELAARTQLEPGQSRARTALLPHSVFVQVIVETGALGTAALIGVVVGFAKTLRDRLGTARPGPERTLALIATAISLSVLAQMPTENLLGQTVIYWYIAALGTFGLHAAREKATVAA